MIRFKIGEMASQIEAARQLLFYVCDEIDSGRRCDKEASMAKLFASEMSERVTSEALQITAELAIPSCMQWSAIGGMPRLTKILRGTSEIRLRII